MQSTPVGRAGTIGEIPVSPVPFSSSAYNTSASNFSSEVDVTGTSTLRAKDQEEPTGHQTLLDKMATWNPCFSSLEGNPHSEVINEEESDGEYATDWSSTEDSDNASEDAELDSDVDGDTSESEDGRSEEDSFQLDHTQCSIAMDSATLTALEIDPELEPEQEPLSEQGPLPELVPLPEVEPLPRPESLVEMCEPQSQPDTIPTPSLTEFGTMSFDDQQKDRKRRVSTAIEELLVVDENMQKFMEYVKEDRVIFDVKQIVELFEGQCSEVGCSAMRKVVEKKLEAGLLLITHKCSKGHSGIWSSSSVLGEKRGQKIYVSSVLLASSVLVSGNNFEKVSLLAKSMNLHYVSSTTFARIQSLYAVPSIREL